MPERVMDYVVIHELAQAIERLCGGNVMEGFEPPALANVRIRREEETSPGDDHDGYADRMPEFRMVGTHMVVPGAEGAYGSGFCGFSVHAILPTMPLPGVPSCSSAS